MSAQYWLCPLRGFCPTWDISQEETSAQHWGLGQLEAFVEGLCPTWGFDQ